MSVAAVAHSDAMQEASAPAVDASEALGNKFLKLLAVVLLGYAVGGRGFAYFGLPPLFIGEITLLIGLLAFVRSHRWADLLGNKLIWPLLGLCVWGAGRTLPFVGRYGIDAVRDAVVWGYAAYAIIVAGLLIESPPRLATFIGRYRKFIPWFLALMPVVFIIYRFLGKGRPEWPWAAVPMFQVKEGDVLVHLSGVVAFWISGLGGRAAWKHVILLTLCSAVLGVIDRAGMMAFVMVFGLCVLFKPLHVIALRLIGTVVLCVAILWVTDLRIPIYGGKGRDVSFDQVMTNVTSVFSDTGNDGMDSTKTWRLDWWREIGNYTFHGKYFWTGKGYGINLADDDGFQVLADNSLRNPHSVHMTILARGGVPSLALWGLTHATFGVGMVVCFLRARREGRGEWAGVFFFLFSYWAALLFNGSFDVFIEGPPGGIWLWSVYGTGLAAMSIFSRDPDFIPVTAPPEPPISTA